MTSYKHDQRIDWIIDSVLHFYEMDKRFLFSKARRQDIVEARHIVAYCLREKYKLSYPVIGAILDRDHTSIMHACDNALSLINNKPEVKNFVDLILDKNNFYKDDFVGQEEEDEILEEKLKSLKTKTNEKPNYKNFLPEYDPAALNVGFPIKFSNEYLLLIFNNLSERTSRIVIGRYSLLNEGYATLDILSQKEGVTRERIRQIAWKGIKKIYNKNYGGVRQIINSITEKVFKGEIVNIDNIINDYYITTEGNKPSAIKFLSIMLLPIKIVTEFELSGVRFFISSFDEEKIINYVDQIKNLISKISLSIPDDVENKWEYILGSLKLYSFFQDKSYLLNDSFLRACYDNYLFESQIILYKTETLKKYKTIENKAEKTSGVPDEYKIFFE